MLEEPSTEKEEEARERQLKKIEEIENLDHKPESWTNEGSLRNCGKAEKRS
jgi:hypothetical protein